jgi:hypothetical protein
MNNAPLTKAVTFATRPLYFRGYSPRHQSDRRLNGPQRRVGCCREEICPLFRMEMEPQFLDRRAPSLSISCRLQHVLRDFNYFYTFYMLFVPILEGSVLLSGLRTISWLSDKSLCKFPSSCSLCFKQMGNRKRHFRLSENFMLLL